MLYVNFSYKIPKFVVSFFRSSQIYVFLSYMSKFEVCLHHLLHEPVKYLFWARNYKQKADLFARYLETT